MYVHYRPLSGAFLREVCLNDTKTEVIRILKKKKNQTAIRVFRLRVCFCRQLWLQRRGSLIKWWVAFPLADPLQQDTAEDRDHHAVTDRKDHTHLACLSFLLAPRAHAQAASPAVARLFGSAVPFPHLKTEKDAGAQVRTCPRNRSWPQNNHHSSGKCAMLSSGCSSRDWAR